MNGVAIPNRFYSYGRVNGKITTFIPKSDGGLSVQEVEQFVEELVTIGGFDQFGHKPLDRFISENYMYYSTTENTLRQNILNASYNRISHAGY